MLGYSVWLINITLADDSNLGARRQEWVAPDLGCYPLQRADYVRYGNGTDAKVTVRTVTQMIPGEPPPSAFTVPEGYVERSPSAVLSEYYRLHPETQPPNPVTATLLDGAYYSNQGKP